eukprot:7254093-Alexandrium_andersonii.AAC.1
MLEGGASLEAFEEARAPVLADRRSLAAIPGPAARPAQVAQQLGWCWVSADTFILDDGTELKL